MSFDCSRFTFNPRRNYSSVIMQQGRVQLDSDWNEWAAELARRIQAGTLDILGRAVFPAAIPSSFKITASLNGTTNTIQIGAGRMYVDGLLAENHGSLSQSSWDPALAELSGAPEVQGATAATVDFTKQPYFPGAVPQTGPGPFLVYLDVWKREITFLERPELVDAAVGVDTTGRIQTVWQVKCLDLSSTPNATCSTPDNGLPTVWQNLLLGPAVTLTAAAAPSTDTGPCCLAPNTGYTGLENQLYRVEIYQAAASGKPATFKWSRDNASVATAVTAIDSTGTVLTVASTGKDNVLNFAPNDWVEITDDWLELNGMPGQMHQIAVGGVNASAKTIKLTSAITKTNLPAPSTASTLDPTQPLDPHRHTRLVRWDSAGAINVPATSAPYALENGITISFQTNTTGAPLKPGDFWTFPARTADGSIGPLNNAPPQGIFHHYARLAVVQNGGASDCRTAWPPSADTECCGCTVTVSPADLTGDKTLQKILDTNAGQGTEIAICLMPGNYPLAAPLKLMGANYNNFTIKACQPGSVIVTMPKPQQSVPPVPSPFTDGMIVLDGVSNVTLSGLTFQIGAAVLAPSQFAGLPLANLPADVSKRVQNLIASIGVRMVNCTGVTVEKCAFSFQEFNATGLVSRFGAAIFASAQCVGFIIRENQFMAKVTENNANQLLAGFLMSPAVQFAQAVQEGGYDATFGEFVGRLSENLALAGGNVIPSILDQTALLNNTFTNLTIATLIMAESQAVEFSSNNISFPNVRIDHEYNDNPIQALAGFWLVTPSQASLLSHAPLYIVLATEIAMGYPMPAGDTTQWTQFAPTSPQPTIRVYAGPTSYPEQENAANVWVPDTSANPSNNSLWNPTPLPAISGALPSSYDVQLYQYERYGQFSYTFSNLFAGFYQVTLKFAEIYYTDAATNKGKRVFNVSINGTQVLKDFDIVADASGALVADDKVFNDIVPNGGHIVIQFTWAADSNSQDHNPKISAVEIAPQWSNDFIGPVLLNSGSINSNMDEFQTFLVQETMLAQQGYVNLGASPLQLRLDNNEMTELSTLGVLVLGEDTVINENISSLMMLGNRIDGSNSWNFSSELERLKQLGFTRDADIGELISELYEILFSGIVTITSLARCLVSSNMVTNESAFPSIRKYSIAASVILLDTVTPSPAIALTGNVFLGQSVAFPARIQISPGAPSNTWGMLNTTLT
jgi:hypothetical protein